MVMKPVLLNGAPSFTSQALGKSSSSAQFSSRMVNPNPDASSLNPQPFALYNPYITPRLDNPYIVPIKSLYNIKP